MLLLAVSVGLLAGCGGEAAPRLAHADAAPLLALSRRIAGEGPCAQARDIETLRRRTVALVNAKHVPAALQDPLMSGVNALAEELPPCLPRIPSAPVTAAPVTTAPTVKAAPAPKHGPGGHGHGHHHGHGHRR
ncbi:MAG: hypothetical protein ACRDM1_02955 [Gaiellaceae bacterium]